MKSVFWWILSLKQQKGSCRFTKIHSLKRQPHISLPQTSVSVDIWVVKEKSKNYHNWTSSASHDVCAAPIFTYIMSGCGLIYEKWMCAKSEGRGMRGGIVRKAHNSALLRHLDLIEYSVLHYAVTQTNISYRQSCILCEMHLKFNRAES